MPALCYRISMPLWIGHSGSPAVYPPSRPVKMCSSNGRLWFLTDRRIKDDYPQQEILRALKAKCCEEDLEFRYLLMDEVVLTIEQGNLGLRVNGEFISSYPQVVVVRVPTPWVQSDSDITVLRHLEKMGCRLMNRPQAILNCVNKFWTFQELAGHGVPLPDTFSYGGHENFSKMIDEAEVLEFPMVVKNTRGHRGKAVFLARDKHHLADLSHLIRHEAPYLFQKYVEESHGRDVRVIVVGGRVIGTMLRCSTDGRMQSNCSLGGIGMMCSLSEQGKQLAIQVSNILGMDVCGIDLLTKEDVSSCPRSWMMALLVPVSNAQLTETSLVGDITLCAESQPYCVGAAETEI
ncbi:beta-citrylglutamate synthase B isoform X3 [Rhinoderma darwinii]|uniref:beta-citrylglutamate synthase B isoform X3 n=1 Tax=Rhinoderma darwinii TaxID=43563 RepID=UPI003F668572